jgi:hypothetical protein
MLSLLDHHMTTTADKSEEPLQAGNYCVSFIDLLGQRKALEGQGLLPPFETESERLELNATLRKSVGAIVKLQSQAEEMLQPLLSPGLDSPYRSALPPEQHAIWDEMHFTRIKTQRWSDGLVSFLCLGDKDVKCRMNGIFALFGMAGTLCFLGLATRNPIRGAIDVAWGVELHPGELYGAAVARAYELESEIAQYPRIVVGAETIRLLQAHHANTGQDPYSQVDKALAGLCLDMLVQDVDGNWLVHYLGNEFQRAISHAHHTEIYSTARKFVYEQLMEHNATKNTKLALRYSHLLHYFEAHPPAGSEETQSINPSDAAR